MSRRACHAAEPADVFEQISRAAAAERLFAEKFRRNPIACRVCVKVVIFCRRAAEIDGDMKILALITVVIYLFWYFLSNNICFYELCTKYGSAF